SSFEMHTHEHVVIGVRGNGICIAGRKKYKIGFLDTLYIKPNEPHQLRNPSNEPFGFFCIVNAKRDRPKTIRNGAKSQRKILDASLRYSRYDRPLQNDGGQASRNDKGMRFQR
ncbi:MAG: cupin domain-containing protein, partial [Thermodesulfovibrionales bacterium]|nr:cupin domain-containing protein [Thermodesulfovibrionales bacterium]